MFLGQVHYLIIIFMSSPGQKISLYAYIFIIIKLLAKQFDSLVLCKFWLYTTLNDNIDSCLAKNIKKIFNPEPSYLFRMIVLFCFVCLGNWNYEKEKQLVFHLNWTLVFNTKGVFVMAT